MTRGSEYGGVAGVAGQFYLRHRIWLLSIVLSILGVATGAATAAAINQGVSLRETALICASAALAGACAMLHTRHLGLAFLTAVAPLPGLAWAAPISAGAEFGAVPLLAYVFAYAVAVMQAQDVLVRALDGSARVRPLRPAAAAGGLTAAMVPLWFWRGQTGDAAFQEVLDSVFAGASVLIVMPICASFLHFDETFVAVANRIRERRQRTLEKVAMTAVPRWGMSIAGVALVFLALAWFEAVPAFSFVSFANAPALFVASAGVVFALGYIMGGGWREGVAATIVAGLVCLAALWAFAEIGRAKPTALVGIMLFVVLTSFLVFCGARQALIYRRSGDDPAVARLRAVEDVGCPQAYAVLGGITALLPYAVLHHDTVAYAAALAFAGAGALGFAPALVTAAETLLPRRRSIEEMYGRR